MHKTESILLIIYDVCSLSFRENEKSNRKHLFVMKRKISKKKKKKKKRRKRNKTKRFKRGSKMSLFS